MIHTRPLSLLTLLLLISVGRADPIRYELIPADVAGYVHVDVESILASNLMRQLHALPGQGATDLAAEVRRMLGTSFGGLTAYYSGGATPRGAVLIRLPNPEDMKRIEAAAAADKDAVVFQIGNQKVYFTSIAPALIRPPQHVPDPPPAATSHNPSSFRFEFNPGEAHLGLNWDPLGGPSYVAFSGADLLVIASDIRGINEAVQVIQGRRPSLAQQDPQGMKVSPKPGSLLIGARLSSSFQPDQNPAQPPATQKSQAALNIDLLNPFRAKTRLARFEISEDGQADHINATLAMVDEESANQLKNLVMSVKAIAFVSSAQAGPLAAALDVQTAGKDLLLHWSFPTAKLVETVRSSIAQEREAQQRAPVAATHPAR